MELCNGTMTFSMREPVMVEPLDYYSANSARGGSNTMNNITNIDPEYNFNNLRNVIHFNCGKMYALSKKYWVDKGADPVDNVLMMIRTGGYAW